MAQSFEVDGNTYTPTSNDKVALTTFGGSQTDFEIPTTVSNEGKDYTVTSIGDHAFASSSSLSSVSMPSSITKIGSEAFATSPVRKVTFSENIDTIMDNAFAGYYLQELVNFPKHLKYVGENAFQYCSNFTGPLFLDVDVVLADGAFEGSGITTVDILGEPKSIGENALDLEELTTVNSHMATPPTFDPDEVFNSQGLLDFSSLVLNVPVGSKVAYMLDDNWRKFGTINEVDFDNGGSYVDENAHIEIDNVKAGELSKLLPKTGLNRVKSLVVSGLLNGDDIATINDKLSLDSLDIYNARIVSGGGPYRDDELGTFYTSDDTLGATMFYGAELQYIKMPKDIKYIGESAFEYCQSLTTAIMGDDVTAFGDMVFTGCSKLDSIHLSTKLEDLGGFTFYTNYALTHIDLPSTLKKIGNDAFYFCHALDNVVLPESMEELSDQAFFDCESLSSINIPKNLTTIGYGVFDRCKSLAAINVDEANTAWKSIDGVLYTKDGSILERYPSGKAGEEFHVPDEVRGIQVDAFWDTKTKTITMGDNVVALGNGAFEMNDNLEKIVLSKNIKEIPISAFFSDENLKTIELPESLEAIRNDAFMGCNSLTEITIPEGVDSIEDETFYNCLMLKNVVLPTATKYVGENAFYGCIGLDSLVVNAVTPPTCGNNPFSGIDESNVLLIVPSSSVEAYKAADVWKDFNIQANTATGIRTIPVDDVENDDIESIFTVNGTRLNTPAKGMNIIRYRDGKTVKLIIR